MRVSATVSISTGEALNVRHTGKDTNLISITNPEGDIHIMFSEVSWRDFRNSVIDMPWPKSEGAQ